MCCVLYIAIYSYSEYLDRAHRHLLSRLKLCSPSMFYNIHSNIEIFKRIVYSIV
jgi:hypothetical protein